MTNEGFTKKGTLNDEGIRKIKTIFEMLQANYAAINRALNRLENEDES